MHKVYIQVVCFYCICYVFNVKVSVFHSLFVCKCVPCKCVPCKFVPCKFVPAVEASTKSIKIVCQLPDQLVINR